MTTLPAKGAVIRKLMTSWSGQYLIVYDMPLKPHLAAFTLMYCPCWL